MPKILSFVFLLTDPELLADILSWGFNCGLMIVVSLCVVAVGNAAHRELGAKKSPSTVDFS